MTTGEFIVAFHDTVPAGYVDDGVQSMARVRYVGITDVSVHVTLDDGTNYRITNPGTFADGLKVEVGKH